MGALLTGKALEAYARLSNEDGMNYQELNLECRIKKIQLNRRKVSREIP